MSTTGICPCGLQASEGRPLCDVCRHLSRDQRLRRWRKDPGLRDTRHVAPSPKPRAGVEVSPYGAEEWL